MQRPSFPPEDDADPPAALSALAEARTSYDAGDLREAAARIDRAAAAVRSAGFVLRARDLAQAAVKMRLSAVVAAPSKAPKSASEPSPASAGPQKRPRAPSFKPPRPSGGRPAPPPVAKPPPPNPAPARPVPPAVAGKPAMRRTLSGTIQVDPEWLEGAIVTDSGREPMKGAAPSSVESVDVWVGPRGEIVPAVRGKPVLPGYAEARLTALSPDARLSERLKRK